MDFSCSLDMTHGNNVVSEVQCNSIPVTFEESQRRQRFSQSVNDLEHRDLKQWL